MFTIIESDLDVGAGSAFLGWLQEWFEGRRIGLEEQWLLARVGFGWY